MNIISLDSYYLPKVSDIPKTKSGRPNFDHPRAFDWELFRNHISELNAGKPIPVPIYDFKKSERVSNSANYINPQSVIILEGIFTLYDKVIRELLSVKCFLDVPCDVRFIRRLQRDVKERGRDLDSIVSQYYDSVSANV